MQATTDLNCQSASPPVRTGYRPCCVCRAFGLCHPRHRYCTPVHPCCAFLSPKMLLAFCCDEQEMRCSRYSSIARCCALSATVVIAGRIMFSDARQLAHTKKSLVFILQGTSTLAHAGKQTIGCYVELQHCNTILASQSLEWARQPRVVWQLLIQLSYYCSLP